MRFPRRTSILALLGLSGGAAIGLPLLAFAGPNAQAPNLRADPVEAIEGPGVYFDTEAGLGNGTLLVRFDGFVTNVGLGPVELRGNPQKSQSDPLGVKQYARAIGQTWQDTPTVEVGAPEVKFEAADSHDHWHLMRVMRYSLWNQEKTAQVAPGQKVGFCLYDIQQVAGSQANDPQEYTAAVTRFCENEDFGGGGAAATSLRMGTSPGWRDVYDKDLAYQWIDVSNTSPGTYHVASEADPDNVIWEGGGAQEISPPTFAAQQVTVPGWVAKPVTLNQTGAPQVVPVTSQQFGSESGTNLRYRIVSAPSNGSLNVPVNGTFSAGQQLTYTPTAGYTGSDSFTYAAFSATSAFPTNPPVAAVTVAGLTKTLTISGAPSSMVAGTSVQLSAALTNVPDGVTWTATSGAITAGGLYSAPGTAPAGGVTVIRATSVADPTVVAEVGIGITQPTKTAKPGPGGDTLTAGRKLLSPLRVTRPRPRIVVGKVVTGSKSGKVAITATFGRKVLGRCATARIGARKAFTCKITLKKDYPLKKVRVSAKFTAAGGKTALRRSFVIR